MKLKAASIGLLASAMVCAPLSEASAHGFRHHGHWLLFAPFEAVGAVVAGVAEIATAPIVLLADAVDGPGYDHRGGYYERHGDYYGRGAPYGRQGSNDYSDPRASDNGPLDYNYGPRDAYAAPPQDYGAPSDPYRGERNYYPPRSAYNAPPQGYDPDSAERIRAATGLRAAPEGIWRPLRILSAPRRLQRAGSRPIWRAAGSVPAAIVSPAI